MYPGYNFITQPIFGQNQMQPPGGQQMMQPMGQPQMGQMPPMGGQQAPGGPLLGQSFMQAPQPNAPAPNHHGGGPFGSMWPMFGLAGLMSHGGSLGSIAPLLGGLAGWGLHKAKVF